MKLFVTILFAAAILSGCVKENGVTPQDNGTPSSNGGPANTPPGNTSGLTHDDSLHMGVFRIYPQAAHISVSGTNLVLKLDEDVDLFFSAEGYKKISAVHLKEDFKNTMLKDFDFTTISAQGNKTLNWVDDNLNNVIKTVKDTSINGFQAVKITVRRQFTFFRVYASNQDALNQQALFASKKDDLAIFSSYTYYNQKNYPSVAAAAFLAYSTAAGGNK